ncbi:hypothetical protein Aglo03_05140 [Actinokineospora globicatena]|uniref:Uncharacterized protein n=1 Tax=Actinokineospora globicatena TaxID=103729 RepID=A0A9W6QK75_9PSEU|nr:hypothetical protein Aglo03_05140 [Actinokineospora globicatena]
MAVDLRLARWVRAYLPGGLVRSEAWRGSLRARWLTAVCGLVLLVVVGQGTLSGRGFAQLGVVRGG